jgi:hypothetical protein
MFTIIKIDNLIISEEKITELVETRLITIDRIKNFLLNGKTTQSHQQTLIPYEKFQNFRYKDYLSGELFRRVDRNLLFLPRAVAIGEQEML